MEVLLPQPTSTPRARSWLLPSLTFAVLAATGVACPLALGSWRERTALALVLVALASAAVAALVGVRPKKKKRPPVAPQLPTEDDPDASMAETTLRGRDSMSPAKRLATLTADKAQIAQVMYEPCEALERWRREQSAESP